MSQLDLDSTITRPYIYFTSFIPTDWSRILTVCFLFPDMYNCCSASWLVPTSWHLHWCVLQRNPHTAYVQCRRYSGSVRHSLVGHMHVWWSCRVGHIQQWRDCHDSVWQPLCDQRCHALSSQHLVEHDDALVACLQQYCIGPWIQLKDVTSQELFTCVICSNRDLWDRTLGHRYVSVLKFTPSFWMACIQLVHVCDVTWPEVLVFY